MIAHPFSPRAPHGWARPAALVLLLLLALAGCRDPDDARSAQAAGDGEGATPERGGVAVLAEHIDINQPMPLVFESNMDGDLQDVLYMALTRGVWRDGRLVYLLADESPMALAERYEYAGPDSAALVYHLRGDVRWSDGQPITAHDVVWTYQAVRDPRTASPRQDYVEHIDSVVARDDSTVVFHFAHRYPEMLSHSGLGIAPRHVYQDADLAQIRSHPTLVNPDQGRLVVSGPFQIGRWDQGQQMVLVPNPHFRPQPHLDQIVIRVIPEATTRLVELQTGAVDLVRPVPHDQIPTLQAQGERIRLEREEKRQYEFIAYNPAAFAPFADAEVRRALGLALDVPGILRALQMQDYALPAAGPYPPIFRDLYDPERMRPLPHDTARARQILAAKGWRDSDGDGVLDKDGRPFRFTLLTSAANPRRADVSQIAQQQWKRLGIDARLQQLEFNTFFERLVGREYQAALGGWAVGLSPDLTELWGEDSPFNIVDYRNPEVSALFRQALAQPTEEAANRYWQAAAARLVQDQPYTWLYYLDQVDAVSNRLRGIKIDTYGAYQNTWEWWIPEALQRGTPTRAGAAPADSPPSAAASGDTAR